MMPPIKEPDLALAGVALLVMFTFLMWHDSPIKNSRPLDPYVQHQDPRITGYGYESWLWQDPFEYDLNSCTQGDQSSTTCVSDKAEDMQNGETVKKDYVTILAPVLKAPNTLENKEIRTRYRYAVIAGLIESGYRPREPNRLHFFSSQKNSSGNQKNVSGNEYDARWERFYKESKPDIVVVWMNSEIFTNKDKLTYVSENLRKFIDKSNKVYIYDLNNIIYQKQIKAPVAFINNISFVPYLNSDEALGALTENLTQNLAKELNLRNIFRSSEVGIITEQGSEDARNLANNFLEHISKHFVERSSCHIPVMNARLPVMNAQPPVMNAQPPPCKISEIISEIKNVFYLKGLDANQTIIDKQDKNGDYQAASKQAERRAVIDLHNPSPLPVGPSQVDYLHRLAKEIKNSHNDINIDKRDSGIKAVGIFGSDFNDKLRILEALRAKMPEILVFTTDLDAQMFSPQHWQAVRNLVVASHFNLRLGPKYQEHFPGFRDSQQTNIFYHTIKLFKDDVKNDDKKPEPKIFEIGRNGPVLLAQEKDEQKKDDESSIDPLDNAQEQATEQLGLLGGITLVLIFFLWQVRPNSNYLIGWLFFGSLIIFPIAYAATIDTLGEPLSFKDGISLWPTVFIQIIATLLACAFIFSTKRILEDNSKYINRQYFDTVSNTVDGGVAWWPSLIFILSGFFYAKNDVSPSELQLDACLGVLLLLTIPYLVTSEDEKGNFRDIKNWAERNPNILGLKDLWQEYCAYGQFEHRAYRVVAIWLCFAIIETLLIYLLPPWPSPCRGDTCDWAAWVGVISFVVIMILLFFILDAVRLNYFWIQKLRTKHPLLVDKTTLKKEDDLKTFDDARINKVDSLRSLEQIIDLVAGRTLKVDRLIYFPMLCIMLMLFARTAYFDNQEFPLSKGITFAASISLLFFAGFMLRNEAGHLKRSVIKCAENLGKDCFSCKTEVDAAINRAKKTEVDEVINRINNVNKGAFEPMFEQPVMRATLIILASIGIFAAKYLKLFE
ncbi:hypothetical protein [Nitrosomonas mobilis]|uniref:Uncharacterized protein n=1 Tax=Nitrosomonas mobilis TaxID=51642 RepID=A0A1G5SBQ2_9PROT|nr:hypothetical protein [Nitrosomonas mobilis]SCZ84633.1 conserved membrane hypothetical protein [Nitrosomonas mobilis]